MRASSDGTGTYRNSAGTRPTPVTRSRYRPGDRPLSTKRPSAPVSGDAITAGAAEPLPAEAETPPADTEPPPADTEPLPADTEPPPADTEPPPADADAGAPPADADA